MSYHNIYSNRYEATSKAGQSFWKMMLVWHGSVFKLIWIHTLVFSLAFAGLSLLYRNVFIKDEEEREIFELICIYCSR